MFLKLQFVKKKFFLKDSFRISRENKKFIKAIIIKITEKDRSGFAECIPYKRYGETQKKIFSYLKNNEYEITQLTRQNRFEEIKYLSLRTALELAFKHLNITKNKKYNLRKKYLTSITIPIFSQEKLEKIIHKFEDGSYMIECNWIVCTHFLIHSPKSAKTAIEYGKKSEYEWKTGIDNYLAESHREKLWTVYPMLFDQYGSDTNIGNSPEYLSKINQEFIKAKDVLKNFIMEKDK
jgi:hypothetical protein